MLTDQLTFNLCQAAIARLAKTVAKAANVQELRALLLADTHARYHSFDVLALSTNLVNLGDKLSDLILEGLDEEGAPL